jgi:GrpB-like predicted nucleotidyltransferase (UPF0157 family)
VDEQQLRAITLGELKPYAVKVVVEDYNPDWPTWYEADRAAITAALGSTVLAVAHTGSTSVPGLPAKPIIDVLLQVPETADEGAYVPQLAAAGYELRVREPEWLEHRLLYRRVEHGAPHNVNVHAFSPRHAAAEITRMLTFRNWLRTHPADRDRYAAKKLELSRQDWKYVQDYADAKTEIITEILGRITS